MNELERELEQHSVDCLPYAFTLSRRDALKLFGSGLIICAAVGPVAAQESGAARARREEEELPQDIASWLRIAEDGRVTVFTGKVEVGQNVRTSLAQQVAEELRTPFASITMIMGDTEQCPYDMGTFGSRTTPQMGPQLRSIAAAARASLIDMAAARWNTSPAALVADNGRVTDPGNHQSLGYGELTRGQRIVKVVTSDVGASQSIAGRSGSALGAETPPSEWRVAGKPHPKADGREFVTGEHKYTSDLVRPGMLYGKVVRPTAFKASLVSVDSAEAEKIDGVRVVRDGNFLGVVAPQHSLSERAARMVNAKWAAPPQTSTATLYSDLKTKLVAPSGRERGAEHRTGSVETAYPAADKKLEATYTVAYIQHAPLETRAAVAEWDGDRLTVWTGTQRPFAVRDDLAQTFHVSPQNVRVIVPDTGAAYGGKHTGDAALEAARLAKSAGRPVKLTWTREEEFTWAYFRPAGVIDVRAGASNDGTLLSWEYDNYNSGPAAIATQYDIPNQRIEFHPTEEPLRQGSYRGLAATANHFARESAMDELAHMVGMDPLQFRFKNLTNQRLRDAFERAAARFKWGEAKPTPERGFGIAGGIEKGGHIATCAEVAVDPSTGAWRISRVVEAFDCGAIVNPNGLRNQIQGAIVMASGGALFEAIEFDNGRILNPHFSEYRVPRFRDVPVIEVELIDRKDQKPAGAGETPIVGLAPAVANAVFSATGKRLRSMPMLNAGNQA